MAISIAMLFYSFSYAQVEFNYDSAIQVAELSGDTNMMARENYNKGIEFFRIKTPGEALLPLKESYYLYSLVSDSAGIANALNAMGVMFEKLGQHDSALICYIQLITIAEKKGYEEILGKGYLNMGILYQYKKEYNKAIHYLDLSIKINKKYREEDFVALALMNKGLVHNGRLEYDSALIKYRQSHNIYLKTNNRKKLAELYNNIGILYKDWGHLDSSDYYYNKAKYLFEEIGDWYSFCQAYNNIAGNAIERGYYNQALTILDSSIYLAKKYENKKLEASAYLAKFEAYYKINDIANALECYIVYDSLDKMVYFIAKDRYMADLEIRYQNEKKQAHILTLETENLRKSKQSNIYLFTGIGFIVLSIFAFLLFRQRAVKNRIIDRQRIKQLEEEKKLLAAKSLVEGQEEERKRIAREIHDGLGVLLSTTKMQFSTITASDPKSKELIDKATKLLEQASSDARKISHNMMPGLLTKLGLYEAAADLFEKVSDTESLDAYIDIPENLKRLPENKEIMVYRIIQELVNNSLKHAGADNIKLRMQMMDEDHLKITYLDDGKGFNFEEKLESKSIGLKSLQSRINFLNGKMKVLSEPGKGVSFRITVPC